MDGLGAFVYLPVPQGDQQRQAGLQELARELEQEDLHSDSDESQIVARLDPASKVREGEEAQLWVDTTRLHLFDPETGDSLTYQAPSDEAPAQAPEQSAS